MGVNNRSRRKAKQKARERKQHAGTGPIPRQISASMAAELLISGAVNAHHDGDQLGVAEASDLLAQIPTAGHLLSTYLQRDMAQTWSRGWQPSELVRAVGRHLDARHERLAIDTIAGQMRVYPASRVDQRWDEQVRTLGATVWWEHDQTYLQQWCDRERLDLPAAIACATGLLAFLDMMPGIPLLCPLPGSGQGKVSGPAVQPRILHKIRALLAKAESTEFAEEAETFTAKAQEIIARHSIDIAMLANASTGRHEPRGVRIGIDTPYDDQKAVLLSEVAAANRCEMVWSKNLGFSTVFGFDTDVESVELLYTSLLVQATTAMTRQGSKKTAWGTSRTRTFRQSFLAAFAVRIGQRLSGATESATRQARTTAGGEALLPVLSARADQVRQAVESHFPDRTYRSPGLGRDGEGWASGTAAADQAVISTGVAAIREP